MLLFMVGAAVPRNRCYFNISSIMSLNIFCRIDNDNDDIPATLDVAVAADVTCNYLIEDTTVAVVATTVAAEDTTVAAEDTTVAAEDTTAAVVAQTTFRLEAKTGDDDAGSSYTSGDVYVAFVINDVLSDPATLFFSASSIGEIQVTAYCLLTCNIDPYSHRHTSNDLLTLFHLLLVYWCQGSNV